MKNVIPDTKKISKRFTWLSISQLIAFAIAAITFFIWAPWMSSLTIDEASVRFPEQVNTSWRAVSVNHGLVTEWHLGTPGQNPLGFSLCTLVFFGSITYLVGAAFFTKGSKRNNTSLQTI